MDAVIHDGKTLEVTYHGVTKARITPIADAVTATGNPVEQAVRSGRAASAVPASPAEE
jgi:(2Fe-2S) ferredoxin